MAAQRHNLLQRRAPYQQYGYICSCGFEGVPEKVVEHVRQVRKWKYLGIEVHYGEAYHVWENHITGQRFAWQVSGYQAMNSRAVK